MSSLRLNPFVINELCGVVARSHDEATVIKYVLSSKEAFVSFQKYVRDHITAQFDKYDLDFFDDDAKLKNFARPFLPKMVSKFVMNMSNCEKFVDYDKVAKMSCPALRILDENKAIDTIYISFVFYKESKFLAALLCRWQGVKNLTCRTRVLLNAAHGNIKNLKRFYVLNLCDDYNTCIPFLTNLPLLTSLQTLKMELHGTSNDLFKITYDRDLALTSLSLQLKVEDASLDYFQLMFAYLKQFGKLESVEIQIHNVNMQSMDKILSNIEELQSKFEKSELSAKLQVHLTEDYENNVKKEETSNFDTGYQSILSSMMHVFAPPEAPNEAKVNELVSRGYDFHSQNVYRRQIRHANNVFIHHVYFKDPNYFDMKEWCETLF